MGMQMDVAPALRKGEIGVGIELLVPEADHPMVEQGGMHRRETRLVEACDIDAPNLGAEGPRQRNGFERHGATSPMARNARSLAGAGAGG